MQIKVFTIPLNPSFDEIEDVNLFLRSHKIIEVRKELASQNGNSYWTFLVTYMLDGNGLNGNVAYKTNKGEKVDYKNVLSEQEFSVFSSMRNLRKQIANNEGVPAYFVFTDAELAEFAKMEMPLTLSAMSKVPKVGKSKLQKYGPIFCETDFTVVIDDEKNREFD